MPRARLPRQSPAAPSRRRSEYLAGVAAGWYVADPAFDPNQLQSEYLREIARDW